MNHHGQVVNHPVQAMIVQSSFVKSFQVLFAMSGEIHPHYPVEDPAAAKRPEEYLSQDEAVQDTKRGWSRLAPLE